MSEPGRNRRECILTRNSPKFVLEDSRSHCRHQMHLIFSVREEMILFTSMSFGLKKI